MKECEYQNKKITKSILLITINECMNNFGIKEMNKMNEIMGKTVNKIKSLPGRRWNIRQRSVL